MWLTSFRPFLLQHLRLCGFLRCTDAQWDATCGQIVPRKTTRFGTLYHKFQLVSGFIYAVGIILKISRGKDSVAEKCQGVVFLTILVVTILARWYWPREGQLNEPCRMLNACFRFEKFLITGYGKETKFYLRVYVGLSIYFGFYVQVVYNEGLADSPPKSSKSAYFND